MGNPIHFATCRDTCRVRDITIFLYEELFKFRKKFLNPYFPNFIKGVGGGVQTWVSDFSLILLIEIWNTGVQELFTEFKKLLVQKNADVANSARFAKCCEMYRISHIVENGQIFSKSLNDLSIG